MSETREPANGSGEGQYDAERGRRLAAAVGDEFRAKRKKFERIACAYLVLLTVWLAAGFVGLFKVDSVQMWIFLAVCILIAYDSTVLIKLWYSGTDTKFSVLRELKLMRLESSAASREVAAIETPKSFQGISRGEWAAWLTAIVAPIFVAMGLIIHIGPKQGAVNTPFVQYVDLSPDGSGKVTTKTVAPIGFAPSETFTVAFDGRDVEQVRWYDDQWHELRSDMREVNGQREYTVHWLHPMLPVDSRVYYQVLERPGLATKDGQGSVWTYEGDWTGWAGTRWDVVVRMPQGAQDIQASPKPTMTCQMDFEGRPAVGFSGDVSPEESQKVSWKVQYRLRPLPTLPAPVGSPAPF